MYILEMGVILKGSEREWGLFWMRVIVELSVEL